MRPSLSVLIVSYRTRDWVLEGLDVWRRHPPRTEHEILVLDNGAGDFPDGLPSSCSVARLIRSEQNLGFGKGTNLLAGEARGDLFLMFNPDARPTAGAIDTLVDVLEGDPGVAGCGPRIVDPNGTVEESSFRLPRRAWEAYLFQSQVRRGFLRRLLPELRIENAPEGRRSVEGLSGACLLIRREAYAAIGGFDEDFFLYWEDFDFCRRLALGGRRLLFVPEATIIHGRSRSYEPGDLRVFLDAYRALRIYEHKHFATDHTLLPRIAAWAIETGKAVLRPKLRPRVRPLTQILFGGQRN